MHTCPQLAVQPPHSQRNASYGRYAGTLEAMKKENKPRQMKYSKKEILQIIKENHRQQIQINKGLPSEDIITYELTIRDWIDEMELLNWDELSDYYSNYFEIDKEKFKLRESMKPEKKKTIKDLCEFISSKACLLYTSPSPRDRG